MAEIQIDSADIFKMMSKPPFENKERKHKNGELLIENDGIGRTKIYIDGNKIDGIFEFKLSQIVGSVPILELKIGVMNYDIKLSGVDILVNEETE